MLRASRDYLAKYPVPPSEYAALAADATSEENFVTLYWRKVREDPKLSVKDFLSYFDEIEAHLDTKGIRMRSEGCTAVQQRREHIREEVALMERVSHGGRQRSWRSLEHDVKHRLLIERTRGESPRSFATAGVWFLTHDPVLPRYDALARRKSSRLPFCVSAGSWFQVVDALSPKSPDLQQVLADLLASPYVRYRRSLSKEVAQQVVARTNLYRDGTPELAARVFMNSAVVEEIENTESPEEQTAQIDNALINAAREVQEEARLAKERADEAA